MTIGDNFNDVSMLQVAGVSFAMGNAEIEVKDYAKYTTDTNLESGVGKAILRAIAEDLQFYLEKRDIDVRIFIQEKQLGRATRTIVKNEKDIPCF